MAVSDNVSFFSTTLSEFKNIPKPDVQYEMHELDIQNMADYHTSQHLVTSDLPHREGK